MDLEVAAVEKQGEDMEDSADRLTLMGEYCEPSSRLLSYLACVKLKNGTDFVFAWMIFKERVLELRWETTMLEPGRHG
jgi:hypothetical protein